MKKIILAATLLALSTSTIISCSKPEVKTTNISPSSNSPTANNNTSKAGENLVMEIDKINKSTLVSKSPKTLQITNKGTVALADAVGGVLSGAAAAGTGLGAIVAPYATLWGAYWFSRSVATTALVANPPINPPVNPTVPSGLEYYYIGVAHNDLIYSTFSNSAYPLLVSSNLNPSINSIIIGANYSGFPTATQTNIGICYNANASLMVGYVNQSAPILTSSTPFDDLKAMVTNSSLTADTKIVLTGIMDDIDNSSGVVSAYTSYFASVEAAINNSALTTAEKTTCKQFIGVAHSSLYFWDSNL